MTAISPHYYANVNFSGLKKLDTEKSKSYSTDPNTKKSSGMSKNTKIAIGLGAVAVATAVIAGLALKKKWTQPVNIDSKNLFEVGFGKIEKFKGNIELSDIVTRAKSVVSKNPKCTQTALFSLDEKGIDLLNKNMKVNISKDLFKDKKGLLLQFFDKDTKLLQSKPIIADSIGKSISELFKDFPCVKLA